MIDHVSDVLLNLYRAGVPTYLFMLLIQSLNDLSLDSMICLSFGTRPPSFGEVV